VVAPLLASALEAYVYRGLSHETQSINRAGELISVVHEPLVLASFDFLVRERGKFRLDLSRECVNGAEIFWNACSFRRGYSLGYLVAVHSYRSCSRKKCFKL